MKKLLEKDRFIERMKIEATKSDGRFVIATDEGYDGVVLQFKKTRDEAVQHAFDYYKENQGFLDPEHFLILKILE